MKTIIIEVMGGCVVDVNNLPEGYTYEIHDHDLTEELVSEDLTDSEQECPNCHLVFDIKKEEKQMPNPDDWVTPDHVEQWLGNDWSFSAITATLSELANGEYDQKQLKKDIQEYIEEETI